MYPFSSSLSNGIRKTVNIVNPALIRINDRRPTMFGDTPRSVSQPVQPQPHSYRLPPSFNNPYSQPPTALLALTAMFITLHNPAKTNPSARFGQFLAETSKKARLIKANAGPNNTAAKTIVQGP